MANEYIGQYLDDSWRFKFDRAVSRLGQTNFKYKTISLSRELTRLNDTARVRNTILHEIAHAMVGPKFGHGPVWQRQAKAIGCDAQRAADPRQMQTVKAPWVGVCPNGHTSQRHRMTAKAQKVSCGQCSPVFNPSYKFSWSRS